MSLEFFLGLLIAGLCLIPIAIQQRGLGRLEAAWRAIAEKRGWVFIPARGPWYRRSDFRLAVASPLGGIDVSWNPGYRGSPRTTVVKRLFEIDAEMAIQLADKLDPALVQTAVDTGDASYHERYHASATRPDRLAPILDADWRERHLGLDAEIIVRDGFLTLIAPGFVSEEEVLVELLALSERFMRSADQNSIG